MSSVFEHAVTERTYSGGLAVAIRDWGGAVLIISHNTVS
jgi:hypothetical protein